MSTRTFGGDYLPSTDAPLDVLDTALTGGGALGAVTYVGGLLVGDVAAATFGVGLGVACVLGTLAVRSVRNVADALG